MIKNCIEGLENYSLTGHTSRYNEDGLTAQQLLIKSARKTRETANTLLMIGDAINNLVIDNAIKVDEVIEEMSIANNYRIIVKSITHYNKLYFLFAGNGKSQIELAGEINSVINQSLSYMEGVISLLETIPEVVEDVQAFKTLLSAGYVCCYDDCSFTLLELAGNTAKNVNDFIDIVNNLSSIVDKVNNKAVNIFSDEVMTLDVIEENEEIIL